MGDGFGFVGGVTSIFEKMSSRVDLMSYFFWLVAVGSSLKKYCRDVLFCSSPGKAIQFGTPISFCQQPEVYVDCSKTY